MCLLKEMGICGNVQKGTSSGLIPEAMEEELEFTFVELPPWLLPEGASIIAKSPEELREVFEFMGWPLAG